MGQAIARKRPAAKDADVVSTATDASSIEGAVNQCIAGDIIISIGLEGIGQTDVMHAGQKIEGLPVAVGGRQSAGLDSKHRRIAQARFVGEDRIGEDGESVQWRAAVASAVAGSCRVLVTHGAIHVHCHQAGLLDDEISLL